MLDPARVHAMTLDLDDTLWPIWPTIQRAEQALNVWLCTHAPMSAALFANPVARQALRDHVLNTRPELAHDLSAVRREAIRLALVRANEDPLLAEPAFEVFFAERHKVDLYEDALPALEWLAQRYPLVSLSNGNADVERVGLSGLFTASLSAATFGVGKPSEDVFHAAAHAAGVLPAQVLHVGDDAHLDVLGALGAGMQAIWVNRHAQTWMHAQQPHGTVSRLTELCELLA
jgi:FMN hydrolase / 5-amino-6-(5-phospho-D-ribitylamino)uracil phosphatase